MTAISSNSTDMSSINTVYNLKPKISEPAEIPKTETEKTNNEFKIKEENVNREKTDFSYDEKTKDMIVRVERNGATFQYPSEDLLRLKKFLMDQTSEN